MDKTAGAARDPAAGPRIHAEASPLVAALAERRGPSVVVPSPGEVVGRKPLLDAAVGRRRRDHVIAPSARRALQAQAVLSLEWPHADPFERLCNSGVRSDQLCKARRDRVMQLVLLGRSLARGVGLRSRALRRRRDRLLDYFALIPGARLVLK
ncbi:hypothetical protein [Mesorhizobium sp.]|uniref:hypothetical protein n=2 Tax=unclassified Mesorhizobium TaxID=325217 RepID=UPI0012161059|nr:hypothetical protein [Mesorhizobium sp.]TIM87495.1 MAG: hypothetical protein E5Y50_11865 [Mesorhizobium sp.]